MYPLAMLLRVARHPYRLSIELGPARLSSKHNHTKLRSAYSLHFGGIGPGCGELPQLRANRRGSGHESGDICVNEEEMRKRLAVLRIEHRDLDAAIDALTAAGASDQLQIARLKKRKLRLKDQISHIEDYLIPDIIA